MSSKKKLCKIVILGDSQVGKTSILHQFVDQRFTQQYRATVGADLMAKELEVDGRSVTLQIWDTAGQERFQNLGGSFYKGSDLCILTFDITSTESFNALDNWKNAFLEYAPGEEGSQVPFVLLGNKVDRDAERQVTTEQAQVWCKNNGNIQFFEVSAKENTNIVEAFNAVAKTVLEASKEEEIPMATSTLQPHRHQADKKCAC